MIRLAVKFAKWCTTANRCKSLPYGIQCIPVDTKKRSIKLLFSKTYFVLSKYLLVCFKTECFYRIVLPEAHMCDQKLKGNTYPARTEKWVVSPRAARRKRFDSVLAALIWESLQLYLDAYSGHGEKKAATCLRKVNVVCCSGRDLQYTEHFCFCSHF